SAEDFPRNATFVELTVDGIKDPVGTWTIDAPAALTCEILGDTLIVAGEEGSFDVDLTFTDQAKRIARAYTSLMIREGELTRSDAIVAEATLGIAGKVVRGNQGQNAVLVSLRIGQTIHQ